MIKTAISHALVAIIISVIGWQLGSVEAGIAAALGFYFGREVAQHERKYPGGVLRGLYFWNWNLDAQLDFLMPLLGCIGVLLTHRYI